MREKDSFDQTTILYTIFDQEGKPNIREWSYSINGQEHEEESNEELVNKPSQSQLTNDSISKFIQSNQLTLPKKVGNIIETEIIIKNTFSALTNTILDKMTKVKPTIIIPTNPFNHTEFKFFLRFFTSENRKVHTNKAQIILNESQKGFLLLLCSRTFCPSCFFIILRFARLLCMAKYHLKLLAISSVARVVYDGNADKPEGGKVSVIYPGKNGILPIMANKIDYTIMDFENMTDPDDNRYLTYLHRKSEKFTVGFVRSGNKTGSKKILVDIDEGELDIEDKEFAALVEQGDLEEGGEN